MNPLYAVICTGDSAKQYLCGLFVSEERANEALAFWNQFAMPGCKYEINVVTTDLIGDQDDASNNQRL